MSRTVALILFLALWSGAQARAQDGPPPEANVVVYGPDFFADSAPVDAYDMARRIPGFTLVESDGDVRGYAAAAGNVLVDGRRPASKQEPLEEILRRIPSSQVARIELIRGSAPGIDLAGHPVVINVVTVSTSSQQLVMKLGASMGADDIVRPQLRIDGSRKWGSKSIEASLAIADELDDDSGEGWILETDPLGDVERETRREHERQRRLTASAKYEVPWWDGDLTVDVRAERELTRAAILAVSEGGASERADERELRWRRELGIRYRRQIGASDRLDALFLDRSERLRGAEQSSEDNEEQHFEEKTRIREKIGRLSYRRERDDLTIDAAVEAALNRLGSRSELRVGGELVPLPGSRAEVTEERVEGSLEGFWRVRVPVLLEAGLRIESSTIRARGAGEQRQSSFFPKPRIAATFDGGKWQTRVRLERAVGQLDFGDFVASASLDRGVFSAGAVSLRPPRTWTGSAALERRFWNDGAIVLTYSHQWIDDVVDRVVVVTDEGIFDAVGNIGSGSRDVLEIELGAPLERFGVKGVRLNGSLKLTRSRVTDPATGVRRVISEDKPLQGEIRLSQDLLGGFLHWGLEATFAERERQFRFDEVTVERDGFRLSAHVEYRFDPSLTMRLELANLTSSTLTEERTRFVASRASGRIDEVERRSIVTRPIALLTVRKSLGR